MVAVQTTALFVPPPKNSVAHHWEMDEGGWGAAGLGAMAKPSVRHERRRVPGAGPGVTLWECWLLIPVILPFSHVLLIRTSCKKRPGSGTQFFFGKGDPYMKDNIKVANDPYSLHMM